MRFGVPFIGSRALVGTRGRARSWTARDAHGRSIADAIRDYGLDPSRIAQAASTTDALGYLEFHIEQGPVLDGLGRPARRRRRDRRTDPRRRDVHRSRRIMPERRRCTRAATRWPAPPSGSAASSSRRGTRPGSSRPSDASTAVPGRGQRHRRQLRAPVSTCGMRDDARASRGGRALLDAARRDCRAAGARRRLGHAARSAGGRR